MRKKQEMSEDVAFFLWHIAHTDESPIKADAERAGLTNVGEEHFSRELQTTIQPLFEGILSDPDITNKAQGFLEKIGPDIQEGTHIVSLDEYQRAEIFSFFAINGCALRPWLKSALNTNLTL